jgi:hypothetical protein
MTSQRNDNLGTKPCVVRCLWRELFCFGRWGIFLGFHVVFGELGGDADTHAIAA